MLQMNDSKDNPISNRINFILSLMIFLVGLWFYLLFYIKTTTYENPSSKLLLFFGIFHYFIFILLAISIYLIFVYGLYLTEKRILFLEKIKQSSNYMSNFLFNWWLHILLFILLFSLLIDISATYKLPLLVHIILSIVFYSIFVGSYFYFKKMITGESIGSQLKEYPYGTILLLVFGSVIYIPIMSILFSDINVSYDKEFYSSNEELKYSIRVSGYIFNPVIIQITYNGRNIYGNSENETMTGYINGNINLSKYYQTYEYSNSLTIRFKPQLNPFVREKTVYIKVTE